MVQISAPQSEVRGIDERIVAQNICEYFDFITCKRMEVDRPYLVAFRNTLPFIIQRGRLKESKYRIITITSGTNQTVTTDVDSYDNLADVLEKTIENRTCVFIDIAIL